jgi:hypothetical protein
LVQQASTLRSILQTDITLCFRVADGRTLRVHRGDVRCGVTIRGKKAGRHQEDSEYVIASLEMADNRGVVFECAQDIRADLLFELVRAGEVVAPVHSDKLQEVLTGIQCIPDGRRHIPVVGLTSEGFVAFAYWTEDFHYDFDLFALPRVDLDLLVIRAKPIGGLMAGSGLSETPTILMQSRWAPGLVLLPTLFRGSDHRVEREPVFVETDRRGQAQSLVEVV